MKIKRLLAITLSLLLVVGAFSVAGAAENTPEEAVRYAELMAQTGIRTAFKAQRVWNACEEAELLIRELPLGEARSELAERVWTVRLMTMGYWAVFNPVADEPEPEPALLTGLWVGYPTLDDNLITDTEERTYIAVGTHIKFQASPSATISVHNSATGNTNPSVEQNREYLVLFGSGNEVTYTITVSEDGKLSTEYTVVVRQESVATSIEISGPDTITRPVIGSKTKEYSAVVKDQYGDIMDVAVGWSISPIYNWDGVEFDTATGTVTVYAGIFEVSYTITATAGGITASKTIEVLNWFQFD